ncbi:MAG: hypothetical protein JXB45_07155 [Candidatus Krumholzibacteriota bacterium]|nr:hypothetical protein [Candidatus Krumholzibacteriota bacterium]
MQKANFMKYLSFVIIGIIIFPGMAETAGWGEEGVETHLSVGYAFYAPWNLADVGYGYDLGLVMRPPYAKYLWDELEKWNLGFAVLSSIKDIPRDNAFRDVCFSLRHYLNRGEFGPHWQSGFVGAGVGIATVRWENSRGSNEGKSNVYLLEAGYEIDLNCPLDLPLVLMFGVNCRIIDAESVSYSGLGAGLSICYGVPD